MENTPLGNSDGFHLSGDEFALEGNSVEEIEATVAEVQKNLDKTPIRVKFKGKEIALTLQFTHAIGENHEVADEKLEKIKRKLRQQLPKGTGLRGAVYDDAGTGSVSGKPGGKDDIVYVEDKAKPETTEPLQDEVTPAEATPAPEPAKQADVPSAQTVTGPSTEAAPAKPDGDTGVSEQPAVYSSKETGDAVNEPTGHSPEQLEFDITLQPESDTVPGSLEAYREIKYATTGYLYGSGARINGDSDAASLISQRIRKRPQENAYVIITNHDGNPLSDYSDY
ncbi:hypothetical protein [Desulfosudis oleivorans]|nr:hypothetical protein [Desulfosudis oleivorans]